MRFQAGLEVVIFNSRWVVLSHLSDLSLKVHNHPSQEVTEQSWEEFWYKCLLPLTLKASAHELWRKDGSKLLRKFQLLTQWQKRGVCSFRTLKHARFHSCKAETLQQSLKPIIAGKDPSKARQTSIKTSDLLGTQLCCQGHSSSLSFLFPHFPPADSL